MTSPHHKNMAAPRSVLLIGGSAAQQRIYSAMASEHGFAITIESGPQPPSAILLELSGTPPSLDAITRARTQFTNAPPILVLTDHGSLNLAVEAMRLGAFDILVRPFSPDRLAAALNKAIAANPAAPQTPANASADTDTNTNIGPHTDTAPWEHSSLDARIAGTPEPLDDKTRADTGPNTGPNTGDDNSDDPRHKSPATLDFGGFIGLSLIMQELYDKIEHVAHSHAPVFITGESGTGKEVCAEAIHRHSRRAAKPFVAINCAAIPRDLIESELFGHVKGAFTGAIADREGAARRAAGGTLFLDEIAEMHPDMQTKLLRFLQNGTFMKVGSSKTEHADLRIICATNRDPLAETRTGRFREDLYYRLHVLPLHMPPLRDRGDDVIDIAEVLIRRYNAEEKKHFKGLSDDAAAMLRHYGWPGNIRQLQNVIRNVIVMHDGELVTSRMLPPTLQSTAPPSTSAAAFPAARNNQNTKTPAPIRPLAEVEREAIENAIAACGGNIPRAAVMLGISPSTIYRKKMSWDDPSAPTTNPTTPP